MQVMKKILCIFIGILIIFGCIFENKVKSQSSQQDISSKIIRFHVIANSDLKSDQQLKLKVRDSVLKYIQPKLKNCKSIDESRKILLANDDKINKIARDVVRENGYNYEVKTMLSNENFPVKTYGNITLPQGNYEAYRIIIGSGKGQNWWCVMFPPLCFVDITKGEASYEQTEKDMKKVLTEEEYKSIDNRINNSDNDIKVKLKLVEMIKNKRIQ
jgi:stage II sporulation protein R